MKCFSCGKEGHQVRACPDKADKEGQEAQDRPAKEPAVEVKKSSGQDRYREGCRRGVRRTLLK